MQHIVKISTPWVVKCLDGQNVIEVRCALPDAANLVLALCMLREELVCSLAILDPKGQKLEVELDRMPHAQATMTQSGEMVLCGLPQMSIEMVIGFYLIYHRDGLADVSHVDLETTTGDYLTFVAADVKPPMSAKDFEEHWRQANE